MAENPLIKRYLDAGMAFTQLTRDRAEALVNDLVRAGEAQADRAEELVNDLVERSRRNTEALLELVRTEVRNQLVALGILADDGTPQAPTGTPAPTPTAARGGRATKASPKKAAAKKTTAKKAAKKSGAKKSGAKKAGGKKAAAKKTATKRAG
jgi:polyhydroxyalkanoate synthesis regulator phasin